MTPHPAKVSSRREYLRLYKWPILGNHCLFHVLWNERWEGADIWLWASVDGNFGAGMQACVFLDMSPDLRGRWRE